MSCLSTEGCLLVLVFPLGEEEGGVACTDVRLMDWREGGETDISHGIRTGQIGIIMNH